MLFIFPTLMHYFLTAMSAFFYIISDCRYRKIVLFLIWLLASLRINVFWFTQTKTRNPLQIIVDQLSFTNIFVSVICVAVELIWTICTEWIFGDIVCRIIKWLQITSLMLSAAFIMEIVILFKYPEISKKRIKENVLLIWIVCLFFASPQLLIFGSYRVGPNNSTQCTVDRYVPDGFEDIILFLKNCYFTGPVIILLVAHSLLYAIFMGKKNGYFWNRHAKDKWRLMKIYLMMVFYTYCLFVALSFLSIYIHPLGIIVEYFHYALLQSGCIFATLNPFLLKKILEKSVSDDTIPKQRYDGISSSSSSSSSSPVSSVSIQLSDDPPSSSLDSVSISLSDYNHGISSSSSLNTVSIVLSGDENVSPNKERKRNTRHVKRNR